MMVHLGADRDQTTLVATSFDMATMLFNASARGAAAYALAAHEKACEQGDEERVAFWRDVCADLRALAIRFEEDVARDAA